VRRAAGVPVDPALVSEITECLRKLAWPTTTRERPAVRAEKYFTLQRPMTRFTAEGGTKAKTNAGKCRTALYCTVLRRAAPRLTLS